MIVLNVTPTSSTAMITFALENVTVGDAVELEPGLANQQSAQPAPASPESTHYHLQRQPDHGQIG